MTNKAELCSLVIVVAICAVSGANGSSLECDPGYKPEWMRCCFPEEPDCYWCEVCSECSPFDQGCTSQDFSGQGCPFCGMAGPGGGSGGGDSGGGGDPPANPNNGPGVDQNSDGKMDCWRGSVGTGDSQADTLDSGDNLGKNHGGPDDGDRPEHDGIDVQCNAGDPIYSTTTGTVDYIEQNASANNCGLYVRVKQPGQGGASDVFTIYCHMQGFASNLAVGNTVGVGQQIGRCNSTGNSGGDHLHLKRREGTTIENPETEMGGCQ